MKPLIPYFDPIQITLFGSLVLHSFGILVAHGMVLGTLLVIRKIRHDGLEVGLIYQVVGLVSLGIFVGGHIGLVVIYYPKEVLRDPLILFQFWKGIYSFGGFVSCIVLVIWFLRREDRRRRHNDEGERVPINILGYADGIVYGFTLGWFLGRMGCFSVHDHPGVETAFWLGVYGICPGGSRNVACHDLGLYEALWALIMLVVLTVLDRKPHFPGLFAGLVALTYGVIRFLIDFLRHLDTDMFFFGLTPAQYGSIMLMLLGGWILLTHQHSPPLRPLTLSGFVAHRGPD